MKPKQLLSLVLGIAAILICGAAVIAPIRDYRIEHLIVKPSLTATNKVRSSTNVAEFADFTGTNAFVFPTNQVPGEPLGVWLRNGTNVWRGSNASFTITNTVVILSPSLTNVSTLRSNVYTFRIRSGIITID